MLLSTNQTNMQNTQSQKKKITKKVERYLKENQKLLKKYGLVCYPVIYFPKRTKVPFLAKMALKVLGKKGGVMDMRFDLERK